MEATTAVESSGNDRSIESDRLSRALTESLTVRDAGKLQYLVGHEGAEYLVDVEAGTCECPDYRHRGKRFVCKHALRASVHHAYRQTHNTRLVARVLAALRDVGCPHDVAGCGGPTDEGQRGLPCEGCIAATPGHWVVYCRLSGHDEWLGIGADADRGEGVVTDGGSEDESHGTVTLHPCSTCDGQAEGDDEQCAECQRRGVSPVDETPL